MKPSAERGSTLAVTLILVLGLVSLTIAGLFGATSGIKVSSNYHTGLQALNAAEAGAVHAQEVINQMGVISFATDVVSVWDQVFGNSWTTMPGYDSVSYSAATENDTTDPVNTMNLLASGRAPNESQRVILARLRRNGVFSPGAIYLPSDDVDTDFNGNAFLVDGHDTQLDGTPHPSGDVPGITTRSDDAVEEVTRSLSGGQADNVIGAGGIPSVDESAGPTTDRITNQIVPNMLSRPGVVTDPPITGNDVFGTRSNPQITHFTGNVTINGTMDGAGILIVDQGLRVSGDMTFTGLIIVRGTTDITTVTGNATVLGALWTTDLHLTVAGSASVTYSTQALALADSIDTGNLVPQRVKAIAWSEL